MNEADTIDRMNVIVKKNLPSGTIVLNRPDKRNALSRQILADIAQAFDVSGIARREHEALLAIDKSNQAIAS